PRTLRSRASLLALLCAAPHCLAASNAAAGIAMTEDTIFAIHSMTKPVTSVATMQLVEQGKLTLDAPVQKFLPALANVQVRDGFRDGEPQLKPAVHADTLGKLVETVSGLALEEYF